MPKEHRKRGRREEKKRKREEQELEESSKRRKSEDADGYIPLYGVENGQEYEHIPYAGPGELPFYGSLDDAEQEYFKRADSLLEMNQFASPEERDLFLENVYTEAKGKELKIANSQSCSRLMERLIQMSTPRQLKTLFQTFGGHFLNLVQHRFASHCCETLFLRAAPLVTSELIAPSEERNPEGDEVYVSMENLFLYTCNELEGNLGYLMTDQFASHPLRLLLVVLSGMPLRSANSTSLMQSKRKENVTISGSMATSKEVNTEARSVPVAFQTAVENMIAGMLAGLDTTNIRALANHPTANPILQLVLEIELKQFGKQSAKSPNSLFRKLLPDDPLTKDTESAAFVNSLVYDTIGSRLLEVIVAHAPGKTFKALYKCTFGEQLGTLAKNEIAAFVVTKVIERLNKDDLRSAVDLISPQIETLVERSRTSVIKTLIDRCRIRQVDTQPIAGGLERAYGTEASERLTHMLKVEETTADIMAEDRRRRLDTQDSLRVHGSLLAQCMLESPGPLRELIANALVTMETSKIISIAIDRTASRVIQCALTCQKQSTSFCRTFIPQLYDHITDLAVDTVASHVVDSMWEASTGLTFVRERIANELTQNESSLRASVPGRAVWRNWKMDMYKTRRKEWLNDAKGHQAPAKSGIELARERFAANKTGGKHKLPKVMSKGSTGVNGAPLKATAIQAA